jgi:hypothetical protein
MPSSANRKSVQVAVVQAGSVPFDADAGVDKAVSLIGEAAATGAKLIVFPEAFINNSLTWVNGQRVHFTTMGACANRIFVHTLSLRSFPLSRCSLSQSQREQCPPLHGRPGRNVPLAT